MATSRLTVRLLFGVVAIIVAALGCAGQASTAGPQPSSTGQLDFHNETDDVVRVFIFEGEKAWFIGSVQPFRSARLAVPTGVAVGRQLVRLGAVPVGGRGRNGDPSTGAMVRSDSELIEHVSEFRWTLAGHTLSAEPIVRTRR
jgi:hypothetical protein